MGRAGCSVKRMAVTEMSPAQGRCGRGRANGRHDDNSLEYLFSLG